jgi:hypothetical protein
MESIQEMDSLQKIVNEMFNVNVMKKSNNRNYADARKTFSKILVDRGFGISEIGRYLKKHHSTIIYYMADVEGMLQYSPSVMDKYISCRNAFLEGKEPIEATREILEQKMYIISLKNKIEKLILEKNTLLTKIDKHKRLSHIVALVDSRTVKGKETFILKKINQMFNGITDYEQQIE